MTSSNTRGFTLLELSLVMLLIALIAGGLIAGKALVKNSQLQAVMSDVDQYKNAIRMFKDKYHQMPGDMVDATSFWGSKTDCINPSTVPTQTTCNGDGDGFIGGFNSSPYNITTYQEPILAWQHLGNAKFISGSYTGMWVSTGANQYTPGLNIPLSTWKQSGFTVTYGGNAGTSYVYTLSYGHVLVLGQTQGITASYTTYWPTFTGAEAMFLDQKMDDGLPGSGNVVAFKPGLASNAYCASSSTASSATYRLDQLKATCSLIFVTGL